MTEETLSEYRKFNETRNNAKEAERKILEETISEMVEHLIKRYVNLQGNWPNERFLGVALPDYITASGRKISLKRGSVRIDKSYVPVKKYFRNCLSKCEELAKSDRYKGMDIDLKYDFLDSAFRTLLMWESYFFKREKKQ